MGELERMWEGIYHVIEKVELHQLKKDAAFGMIKALIMEATAPVRWTTSKKEEK
jgi:hypothetical protein